MKELAFATVQQIKEAIEKGEVCRKEVLDFFLKKIEKNDETIKSLLEVFDADSILKESSEKGFLSGIPGVLKDNICQKNRKLSCASKIFDGFVSPYDATVSSKLKEHGALLAGRANLDEFAMGASNETSAFFKTKNPWDTTRVPGGSSGGSAAAVAAGLVPWGLGSDTGGSVRQPASFCGIVGIKPTYGLVSRYGLVAYGSSLDQIGVHTKTVYDNALVLSAIAGHDLSDSTSLSVDKRDYTKDIGTKSQKTLTIGVIDNDLNDDILDKDVYKAIEESIDVFKRLGFNIKRVSLPSFQYCAATYFILSRAEAASNLARYDGVRYGLRCSGDKSLSQMYYDTRNVGFGKEVKCRILVGNYVLSVGHADDFYVNAQKAQRIMREEFQNLFKDVDVLLSPTQAMTAFKIGQFDNDKLKMDLCDSYTAIANLSGIPAMSVPCGFDKLGLPIGLQLLGPHLSESTLYKVAYKYEQATEWHKKHPQGF